MPCHFSFQWRPTIYIWIWYSLLLIFSSTPAEALLFTCSCVSEMDSSQKTYYQMDFGARGNLYTFQPTSGIFYTLQFWIDIFYRPNARCLLDILGKLMYCFCLLPCISSSLENWHSLFLFGTFSSFPIVLIRKDDSSWWQHKRLHSITRSTSC
jgi:hypothetical protein